MTTTNDMEDRFEDAERGLEWLEKLEALQARSASDRAALDVAEYVMKLRAAVTALAGGRSASELAEAVGAETARLVEELRQAGDNDYWNTRIRPALLKSDGWTGEGAGVAVGMLFIGGGAVEMAGWRHRLWAPAFAGTQSLGGKRGGVKECGSTPLGRGRRRRARRSAQLWNSQEGERRIGPGL